jgi:hypothetical protein
VVTGTVISSSAFNALTADLANGLSTAITKDGQTATTVRIPFAQGINSTLATDTTSGSTGSIFTAGGVGIAKALYVGTNATVVGTLGVTGAATFSTNPVFSALTASSAVATDASKNLVSVTNTGTGNNVLATSPTLVTPVLGVATATSINKVALTAPATAATLTIADGATLATSGAYSLTLTATAATNVTLPTTGTLATLGGSETFTNKTLTSPTLTTPISTTTLGVGNATPSASGAGITFPATQSASTDANTLDDYEEGTWTPAITFGGGSTGITYSSQSGFYTKIGNTVTVQFRINLSSKGSSTGSVALGGLPFTSGGTYAFNYVVHDNAAGFNAGFGMYWSVENGSTSGNLRQIGTNGSNGLDNTNFNNNTAVFGILTYRV